MNAIFDDNYLDEQETEDFDCAELGEPIIWLPQSKNLNPFLNGSWVEATQENEQKAQEIMSSFSKEELDACHKAAMTEF